MTVIETRLSARAERGFSSIAASSTRLVELKNGQERRNANWAMKKRRYTARYGNWTQSMRDELLNLAHATEGMLYAFRFKDWSDFSVTGQSLGTSPTGTTAVQLVKTYTFGSRTHTRTITRPVSGTVKVYENGVLKTGSVDTTTGLFTPSTSWASALPVTADFEFDVPVRFASDEIEFVLPDRDIAEVNCELVEVFGE